MCQSKHGCNSEADEVHHIVKITERPDLRLDDANSQALCHYHQPKLGGKGGIA
jgi:5-methylcytosine-specific restriction endonuclease McrA